MNVVVIMGRLARDPELRQTGSGKDVVSFAVAVNRTKDEVAFIPCTAWDKTAELIAQHFSKGKPIGVTGHLSARSYTDKSGNKRTVMEVVCDRVYFVPRENNQGSAAPVPAQKYTTPTSNAEYAEIEDIGDLPFDM